MRSLHYGEEPVRCPCRGWWSSASRHSQLKRVAACALPAHVAGPFEEIAACHLTPDDDYLVFDRRCHAVSRISADGAALKEVVQIGVEPGRILRPIAFASAPDGTFIVADAPNGQERIQIFLDSGSRIGGFTLPGRSVPRVTLGDPRPEWCRFTRLHLSHPRQRSGEWCAHHRIRPDGRTLRTFGDLRRTGHEGDKELHLALNGGCRWPSPVAGSTTSSSRACRRSGSTDAEGKLLYERHIEGPEIDEYLRRLPTIWPRRKTRVGEFPIVTSAIRTAVVGPDGSLWIALLSTLTYVYDIADKRRIIQFRGAGILIRRVCSSPRRAA